MEKLAHVDAGAEYLAEAVVRSTATGRPLAGHIHAPIAAAPAQLYHPRSITP